MQSEKGQALPMALVALAIGTLLVVPFLSHASSSLIGSRLYGDIISEQSAGDAGIEHAIWSLTRGSLAEQFTGPGDEVSYQLPEAVNGINVMVTVTANATSQGGTPGEIADTVIDTLEFDTSDCYIPSIIQVSGNIYAIAYRGPSNRGYLETVSITAGGDIGNSVIDTLTFDASACYEPDIVYLSGNTYAVAYRGSGNDGFLKTVSIAASGTIGNSVIDTLEYDASACYTPSLIHVSGNIYAIAYRGPSNRGYLKTVSITAGGDIGNSVIDTLTIDTTTCYEPDIIYVSGDVYAIPCRGVNNDGFLTTMTISTGGDIGGSVIDTLQFDTSTCYKPVIVKVSGDVFAIAYRGVSNDGFLRTVGITTQASTAASWEILSTAGASTIRAFVNTDNTTATIVSWLIE